MAAERGSLCSAISGFGAAEGEDGSLPRHSPAAGLWDGVGRCLGCEGRAGAADPRPSRPAGGRRQGLLLGGELRGPALGCRSRCRRGRCRLMAVAGPAGGRERGAVTARRRPGPEGSRPEGRVHTPLPPRTKYQERNPASALHFRLFA